LKELLIPAVAFMNRLKYVQKFILISAIFLIPTGLTVYLLMADIDRQIEFTKKERLGIEYNDAVRQLLEHFQQHRGMVNANLNGESSFRESIISKQAQIEQVINQIDLIDGKSGKQLRTGQRWNSIKTGWESLREDMYQSPPIEGIHLSHTIIQENFEMHSSLIAGMLSLIVHISEASSLKLEPGYDSYLLMDTTVNKLPMVIETTGKLRGFGSGIAAKKTILPEEKLQLTIWSQMILSALQDMEGSMDTFDSPKLTALLSPLIKQFLEETRVFTEVVQRELIDVEQLHIESSKLFDIGTNAIELGYSLYDKESPYLDHILEERVDQLFTQKVFIIAFSVMVTLIIAYLFAAFYESTIRTVFALKQASMRFADGDMSARIDLRVKDELQVVGHAFNTMVDAFEQMLAERRLILMH
jgi:methyl-accepting chemotaxis protein